MKISDLSDKELKAMVIKVLTKLRKRIDENRETINKELDDIKKSRAEEHNTEMKSAPRGANSRLGGRDACVSGLKGRIVKISQASKNIRNFKKQRDFKRHLKQHQVQ